MAYDCTAANAINTQHVVQERLTGQSIEEVYDILSLDQKPKLAAEVAQLMQTIESIRLPNLGRLVHDAPMPEVSSLFRSEKETDSCHLSDTAIGISGYRLNDWTDMPTTDCKTLASLLKLMCRCRNEESGDEAMEVPRVIGRKPPVWLWRPDVSVEDADSKPSAPVTSAQHQIRSQFYKTMIADDPSFHDDTTGRGRWLRRIWEFVCDGFSE